MKIGQKGIHWLYGECTLIKIINFGEFYIWEREGGLTSTDKNGRFWFGDNKVYIKILKEKK